MSPLLDWGCHSMGVLIKLFNELPEKIKARKLLFKNKKGQEFSNWKLKTSFSSNRHCYLFIGNGFPHKKRVIKVFLKNKKHPIILNENTLSGITNTGTGEKMDINYKHLPMENLLKEFKESIIFKKQDSKKSFELACKVNRILLDISQDI